MAVTTFQGVVNSVLKNFSAASDSSAVLSPSHFLVDANGADATGTPATAATQPAGGTGLLGWLSGIYQRLGGTLTVTATALPLPAGAATAARQPALGTAGSASADVVTIQGIDGGTPQAVRGAAVVGGLAGDAPVSVSGVDATGLKRHLLTDDGGRVVTVERPFQGVVPFVMDTAQPAQRAVRVKCSVAGNVSLTYADGSVDVVPVVVGMTTVAGAITKVNASGTTATATYVNLI